MSFKLKNVAFFLKSRKVHLNVNIFSLSYTYFSNLLSFKYYHLDCKRIRFNNETDTDLLRVFKVGERAAFKIDVSTLDFVQTVLSKFSYQACDGGWIPLNNTGLQVTLKLWTQFAKSYMLEVRADGSWIDILGDNLYPFSSLRGLISTDTIFFFYKETFFSKHEDSMISAENKTKT